MAGVSLLLDCPVPAAVVSNARSSRLGEPIVTLITYVIDWLRRLGLQFSTDLPRVATYTRELPVSLTRMYENAIDGEHLPWLHRDSFSSLEILDSGPWSGELTLESDGTFTYTPPAAYTGPDSFAYTITDGNGDSDANRFANAYRHIGRFHQHSAAHRQRRACIHEAGHQL